MCKKELDFQFHLVHIVDNQFSTFDKMFDIDKPIEQQVGFGFGVDIEKRIIVVSVEFIFQKEEKPLLKQSVTCYFEISSKDFDTHLRKEKKVVLPCGFGKHLAMLTTGTARGVLFANTKNTPFNKYLIGLINVDKMFDEDIHIEI